MEPQTERVQFLLGRDHVWHLKNIPQLWTYSPAILQRFSKHHRPGVRLSLGSTVELVVLLTLAMARRSLGFVVSEPLLVQLKGYLRETGGDLENIFTKPRDDLHKLCRKPLEPCKFRPQRIREYFSASLYFFVGRVHLASAM